MASSCIDHGPHTQLLLKLTCLVIATALRVSAKRIDKNINPDGCGQSEPVGRVYNGEPIAKESIPWIVHLEMTYGSVTYQCGGSVITRNVILTAAHCLFMGREFPDSVKVWFNSARADYGKSVQAARMKLHPKFVKRQELVYDVALLKLAGDLKFSRMTKPVCLPEGKLDVGEKSLLVAGWGRTESADDSKILLHAQLDGLTDEDCQKFLRRLNHPITRKAVKPGPMVCARGSSTNVCEGDSGGPLTLLEEEGRWTQVGIASVSVECAATHPSMFSSVAFNMDWINKMLNKPGRWRKLQVHRSMDMFP